MKTNYQEFVFDKYKLYCRLPRIYERLLYIPDDTQWALDCLGCEGGFFKDYVVRSSSKTPMY
jgi:hypothetical protein